MNNFLYNDLSITAFHAGVQFNVDLVINGKRRWSSTRRNSSPHVYPLLRQAIGLPRKEQEDLFTRFFLEEEAENARVMHQKKAEDARVMHQKKAEDARYAPEACHSLQ
jgi:hypothetical protein